MATRGHNLSEVLRLQAACLEIMGDMAAAGCAPDADLATRFDAARIATDAQRQFIELEVHRLRLESP